MYELFTKRFIDLLDERAPVTMVHTVTEQPLGSVVTDSYTLIHARIDVADEDSPYAEIEVFPLSHKVFEVVCDLTLPKTGLKNDEPHILRAAKALHEPIQVYKVQDTDTQEIEYDMHMEFEVEGSENKSELDQIIEDLIEEIVAVLKVGGYEIETFEEIVHS
jgi:hypothetical protein